MSGYMPAQALLKTLLLTDANFGAGDVVEGDLRVQDSGADNLCILFPGALQNIDLADFRTERVWEGFADLFTRYVDTTSYNAFGTLRDSVVATIDASPTLSPVYVITAIRGEGDPYEVMDNAGGGPYFIAQRLRITIMEYV